MGTHVSQMRQARTAAGALVHAVVGDDYDGELLLVRSDGIVIVRNNDTLVLIRWNVADRIEVKSLKLVLNTNVGPTRDHFERLRLSSRHPYGLTDAQVREVLARYKQTDLLVAQR
jgi:hypothetical protein